MRDADGALIGFATVARDITHQVAAQAELAAARADREVMAERDRIARDLHDMVIQRVFGAGLALQSVTARITRPDFAARIHTVIEELDATIRELRGTIFELGQPAQKAASLRAQVLDEAATARAGSASPPRLCSMAPSTPRCPTRRPPTCWRRCVRPSPMWPAMPTPPPSGSPSTPETNCSLKSLTTAGASTRPSPEAAG